VIPAGWQRCNSTAIEAFRYLPREQVLQIAYVKGRYVYDFPCPPDLYKAFLVAPSKGRYVQYTLKPYASRRGWTRTPYRWPWL
jgi:hypothetical protein